MTASLTERIEARRQERTEPVRVVSLRPTPIWIRRMRDRGLPVKDSTSDVFTNGAWTPPDEGGAA